VWISHGLYMEKMPVISLPALTGSYKISYNQFESYRNINRMSSELEYGHEKGGKDIQGTIESK